MKRGESREQAQLAIVLVHLGASRARERLPSKANLPGKSLSLPAQVGQVGVTTQHLPLLVRKVFGGVWVPLAAHLTNRANQLVLRKIIHGSVVVVTSLWVGGYPAPRIASIGIFKKS